MAKVISTKVEDWIHYILLTAVIVGLFYFLGVRGVYSPWKNLVLLFLVLALSDQLLHKFVK